DAAVGVAVSPTSATVVAGGKQAFTATVTGSETTGVTWFVADVSGGNATVGTIDANGLYTAPAVPPSGGKVAVRATTIAQPAASATATVTVIAKTPTPTPSPTATPTPTSTMTPTPTATET